MYGMRRTVRVCKMCPRYATPVSLAANRDKRVNSPSCLEKKCGRSVKRIYNLMYYLLIVAVLRKGVTTVQKLVILVK